MPTRTAEARRQALEARESGAAGVLLDPSFLLELLDESDRAHAEHLQVRAARVRSELRRSSGPTVHILQHGNALCGKPGHELDGSTGHTWAQPNALAGRIASCPECRTAFGLEPRRKVRR